MQESRFSGVSGTFLTVCPTILTLLKDLGGKYVVISPVKKFLHESVEGCSFMRFRKTFSH